VDKEKRRHNQQAGAIIREKSGFGRSCPFACGDSAAAPWPASRRLSRIFGRRLPDSAAFRSPGQGFRVLR
jgi:hypothetical protein